MPVGWQRALCFLSLPLVKGGLGGDLQAFPLLLGDEGYIPHPRGRRGYKELNHQVH